MVSGRVTLGGRGVDNSRRNFLLGLSALAGFGAIMYGNKGLEFLDEISRPAEELRALQATEQIPKQDGHYRVSRKYVEFRGTVFEIHPTMPEDGDGPERLVRKANLQYNGGAPIRGDLGDRALDLFNILQKNKLQLEEGQIKNFKFKTPSTPTILRGRQYLVPTVTAYGSLNDVLTTYKR